MMIKWNFIWLKKCLIKFQSLISKNFKHLKKEWKIAIIKKCTHSELKIETYEMFVK